MKVSTLIKILERVQEETGGDPPLYMTDCTNPIGSFVFDYEYGRVVMFPIADNDESTTSIIRKIDREILL